MRITWGSNCRHLNPAGRGLVTSPPYQHWRRRSCNTAVWGDGDATHTQVISATDLPAFGSKKFSIPFDAAGKKWVRFAVWDSAGNGAFTQPVHLNYRRIS